jgi:hypothetical protein
MFVQILQGVAHMHRNQFAHRNLSGVRTTPIDGCIMIMMMMMATGNHIN